MEAVRIAGDPTPLLAGVTSGSQAVGNAGLDRDEQRNKKRKQNGEGEG